MARALAFIGGGLLQGLGKGIAAQAIETGKDKRDRAIADLEHTRGLERDKAKLAGQRGLLERRFELESGRPPKLGAPIAGVGPEGKPGFFRVPETGGPAQRVEGGFTPKPDKDDKADDKTFEQADKLRKQFDKESREFVKVRDSYGRILRSAEDPSAAGDLALIFNYMKVLDPGSTVREGEFATAQNAAGVPDRVRAFYRNLIRGERMTPVQRDDFVNRAGRLYESQLNFQDANMERFTGLADAFDIDPATVVSDLTQGLTRPGAAAPVATPPPPPPPAVPFDAPPGTAPLPAGIPPESVLEGTKNGNPVYRTPDGRLLEVRP